jgi:hypothetical protein
MKKFIIALSITALTVSAYAMSKAPANAEACSADKACAVKDAAKCCTADGSCKTEKAEACATKAVEEKAECAGGVCPLKK